MAPLTLPPDVLKRLKRANAKGQSSETVANYVLGRDSDTHGMDENESPGLIRQMKEKGFSETFCEFTLDFLERLKQDHGQSVSPSDAVNLAKQGFNMDNSENLVQIIRSMNEHLMKKQGFSMRMNQIAALLTLLFGSSEEVCKNLVSRRDDSDQENG